MYKTERLTAEISVKEYIEDYVNVEEFLECCKKCGNYRKKWSCPPYDFDVMDYWRQYESLYLLGCKIFFGESVRAKSYEKEQLNEIIGAALSTEKQRLTEELYQMEKENPGSISLSAGSCSICGGGMMETGACTRNSCENPEGSAKDYCRCFDKMRYSIESIGGNVGKTCSDLLGVKLEWVEEGKLPEHFVLVCGLLKKE